MGCGEEVSMNEFSALKGKNLALFFTFSISLKMWYDLGIIDREVALYNKLSKYFKRIYFFTYGGKKDLEFKNHLSENITIVPVPFIHTSKLSKIFFLPMLIYSFLLPFIHYRILRNVDVLKTNQMCGSWTAVMAKIIFKKKLIVRTGFTWSIFANMRNSRSWKNILIKTIEKFSYFFADGVIVSSSGDLEYLKKNYKLKGIQIVIPNSVDTNIFKSLNVQKRKNSICFVGRLSKEKNLFSLLEALVGLPYFLTLIGSGPEREMLKKYSIEKGIEVKFLGNLPNSKLPEVLSQHEIFILPSLYEGMPKALLEAMACGLPVIGTDVNGIKEVIEHRVNGILCGIGPESIRESIKITVNHEELKRELGKNARLTVERKFSLDFLEDKEINYYTDLFAIS